MRSGEPDVLGPEYTAVTLPMGSDEEGEVVATLVRRRAEVDRGRAVLYLHGFVDYFFQHHLADFYIDRGYHFYALDLRKYGRSLRPHQTPNFCRTLAEYCPEIDEAVRIIREEDGAKRLLLNGHSTGGLLAALWAHRVRGRGLVDGVFLNSPFFDQNVPPGVRVLTEPLFSGVARWFPHARIPLGLREGYGQSIHSDHFGEWTYDVAWKPHGGFPVEVGWLAAVLRAQRVVRRGLAIDAPVLVLSSSRSHPPGPFTEALRTADAVLNIEHMARWSTALGPHVTYERIDGGLHDLTLSAPEVRAQVFGELGRWMDAYLPERDAR